MGSKRRIYVKQVTRNSLRLRRDQLLDVGVSGQVLRSFAILPRKERIHFDCRGAERINASPRL